MGHLKPLIVRDPNDPHRAATQLEIFFDLVAVISIAALTAEFHHAVSHGHGSEKFIDFLGIFVAIWWAWMNHTWYATAFDNDDTVHRVLTFVIMSGFLIFAAGMPHIFETLDFAYGLAGWIVMRFGMLVLWARAAISDASLKHMAARYFWGLVLAQTLWVALYFLTERGSNTMMIGAWVILLVEFSVPLLAGLVGNIPWHRQHLTERYGLLNIIVLGEVLLSISFMFAAFYQGDGSAWLILSAISGLVIVFVLWWVYFLETEHFKATTFWGVALWGYGHIFIYLSGALVAVGMGAWYDVLTGHAHIPRAEAVAYVAYPIAVYFITLFVIRDIYHDLGPRMMVLPISALTLVLAGAAGAPIWVIAGLCFCTLVLRMRPRPSDKEENME